MGKASSMFVATTLVFVAACNMGSSDVKPTTETRSVAAPETNKATNAPAVNGQANVPAAEKNNATGTTTTQPASGTTKAVATPDQQTYPLDAIKTVADDCKSAEVLLATAPKSVGPDYAWNVTRQAMLANQQFKVIVDRIPSAPGEVHIAPYGYTDGAFALTAKCGDGATCNRLAAMYKAVVRSSRPQVVCGTPIAGISSTPVGTFRWDADPKANLPQDGELQALCARLSACTIATDQSTPGDPFLDCQKAPAKFKTDCAKRYPCAEVLACTGK
jgi:hypothetical protein